MPIERHRIGVTRGHPSQGPSPVDAIRLSTDQMGITVWTYGATLVEVLVPDREGQFENVVIRLPDLKSYEQHEGRAYLGSTMGRYARCISGGQIVLDDKFFGLTRNQGIHHIHGGRFGFDSFVWSVVGEQCTPQRLAVRMRLCRPDSDEGYPGEITVETTYAIEQGHTLIFEHTATTTAPTVCDITNHAMWNLSGHGTIDSHQISVNANRVLLVNEYLIPRGAPVSVSTAGLDFRLLTSLVGRQIDNCFVLEDSTWAACLIAPLSGRRMTVITDQLGLQCYSGDQYLHPRAGICLQAGSWPNAPIRHDYPSARLNPGETYRSRTIHRFDII